MSKPNGFVLYRGPSMLDGAPIIVVAIGFANGSQNTKTGAMIQTYIMRADVAPIAALRTGDDASVCGDCIHRGQIVDGRNVGRTCYVNVGQGPTIVHKSIARGIYPDATTDEAIAALGNGRIVRLGTYGDPAAVPVRVWQALVSGAKSHTGYTHQWRISPELRTLCMASADSAADAFEAQDAGWRTFRVALPTDEKRIKGEAMCPASAEAGKKLTCADCTMCHGAAKGLRGSIVIQAHGGFAVSANIKRRADMFAAVQS